MEKYMSKDEKIRIQYASKYRSVSNAWKKWKGMIMGLHKANALEVKENLEEKFMEWVKGDSERIDIYGNVLSELENLYNQMADYMLVYEYASEAFLSVEIMDFILEINAFLMQSIALSDSQKVEARADFMNKVENFFKNYHQPIDEEIFSAMLESFYNDIDPVFHPEIYREIQAKFKGDFKKFSKKQFKDSNLVSKDKVLKLFENYPEKVASLNKIFRKDPLYQVFISFSNVYSDEVNARFTFIENEINSAYRTYVQGLREMDKNLYLYPDANFTMRIAYGMIEGYTPKDAVFYNYQTDLSGLVEKYNTGLADYIVPEKLLKLYHLRDYGPYADKNGSMNVCFIASNHTSGGNSGSPVLNADGELIGLNFDRNWEGTMSDIFYDRSQCRIIAVDIRYVLFIIDKFAGAGYLLDEMNIIKR